MSKRRRWGHPPTTIILLLLFLLALAPLGRAADTGHLPTSNWLGDNLSRIKVPAGKPVTFAVLGDNRGDLGVFGRVLKKIDQDPGLTFAIHLGDMVKDADLDKYHAFLKELRQDLHKPLLTVIGNHELNGEQGLELYHDIFGPDYYSFQINNHYFIAVNDAAPEGPSPGQLRWLEDELQKSQAFKTRLVFLHIPLFDPRGGAYHHSLPPEAAYRLLALFKKYKVTHVFAAHIHDYYAGDWEGLPFTITGGAGAPLYGSDPQHAFYHYLKVSIRGDWVKIEVRPVPAPARH